MHRHRAEAELVPGRAGVEAASSRAFFWYVCFYRAAGGTSNFNYPRSGTTSLRRDAADKRGTQYASRLPCATRLAPFV